LETRRYLDAVGIEKWLLGLVAEHLVRVVKQRSQDFGDNFVGNSVHGVGCHGGSECRRSDMAVCHRRPQTSSADKAERDQPKNPNPIVI
jgi:hypothetical protein